jgi:hypothetical protein
MDHDIVYSNDNSIRMQFNIQKDDWNRDDIFDSDGGDFCRSFKKRSSLHWGIECWKVCVWI